MTITKSGALASFYTVNKAPIKHLRVYFSPKQAGSGTASPENIRPIDGWNSINLLYSGKNLVKNTNISRTTNGITFTINTDGSVHVQGTATANTWWSYAGLPTTYIKAGTYRLTGGHPYASLYLVGIDDDGTEWSEARIGGTDQGYGRTFTLTQGAKVRYQTVVVKGRTVDTTIYPMLTKIEEDSTFAPYEGINNIINFPETIYGGYVDLITGELVQEWDGVTHIWQDGEDQTTDDETKLKKRFRLNYPPISGGANNISNVLNYGYGGTYVYNVSTNNSNGRWAYVTVPTDVSTNLEIQLIYKLATPITHQLSPQSLATFLGRNNIWSNADRIEVEYNLAESNDELYHRRNILLQGAPHLETATGNIANFKTDLIAPIKEAKVYFEPKQLGSGDPSPSNVREIVGYTGLEIKHTGGNLMDPTIAGSTQGQVVQTNVTPNADGTVTIAGRDGTGWVNRAKIDLPAGTYRLYSDFGSGYFSRYEINDIAEEINWQGYKTLTLDEPSYLRFKPAMGTNYPATGWLQLLYDGNEYDPRPYIEEKINVTFPTIGKNLLDITRTEKINPGASTSNITISNGIISIDAVAGSARSYVMFEQNFPAGTYTIQAQNSGAVAGPKLLATSEFDGSSYNNYYAAYTRQISANVLTFTLPQTSKLGIVLPNVTNESGNPGTIYDIQLENGSTATVYKPYTNTIYGGYIDLINGEIVVTYGYFNLSDNNTFHWMYGGGNGTIWFGNIANNNIFKPVTSNSIQANLYCNNYTVRAYNSFSHNSANDLSIGWDIVGAPRIRNNAYDGSLAQEFIASLKDTYVVIELKNPIHYLLTPQTLKTLKGTNNIWSSANGPVSIKYWTH